MPPGSGHINGVRSYCFQDVRGLLLFSGMASSLVIDFFVKTTGKQNLHEIPSSLPWIDGDDRIIEAIVEHVLQLTCLTDQYADLWRTTRSSTWSPQCALRTDHRRRNGLVELDALAALALGLTEEELVTIYRVQFPVLQQYEREDRYDRLGHVVPGEVLRIAERAGIDIHVPLNVHTFRGDASLVGEVDTPDLGMTGGIRWLDPKMEPRMERIYPPPYLKNDRETEMRQAYRTFAEQMKSEPTQKSLQREAEEQGA